MRFAILSTLCLVGSVIAAPVEVEKRAENYYEIISRRTSQVRSTLQSLESHLRSGAPTAFDRNRQQEQQIAFFRKSITLNDQVTYSMKEGAGEMAGRIPRGWKMSLTESTSFTGVVLPMQSTLNTVLSEWSKVRNAATALGATKDIGASLANAQKTTGEFISHIMEHQNALTSAVGLDRSAKTIIENNLSRVVREYNSGK